MKKIECYIVQDLLPLYIDHACSKQTTEDIEGHLQSCESCKKLYEEMSSDICSALQTPASQTGLPAGSAFKSFVPRGLRGINASPS